jgi:hypothetical protein
LFLSASGQDSVAVAAVIGPGAGPVHAFVRAVFAPAAPLKLLAAFGADPDLWPAQACQELSGFRRRYHPRPVYHAPDLTVNAKIVENFRKIGPKTLDKSGD